MGRRRRNFGVICGIVGDALYQSPGLMSSAPVIFGGLGAAVGAILAFSGDSA